jgi:pimeloyl-ACP methyl ester carboxylesterase
MDEQLPIVYVRGYAGGGKGIDTAVDDPFYGFNSGSTHVRVGADYHPVFYQFESPLIRLMQDEGYRLEVHGDQKQYLEKKDPGDVEPNTIWIHRFYDEDASTFGAKAEKFSIEEAAADLLELIRLLQEKTKAPRVHLVAHSMGGLICRSLIQKVIPDQGKKAADVVDRLFTFATPHGGIEFAIGFGLIEGLRDAINFQGADIFGPKHMWEFLTPAETLKDHPEPPNDWQPQEMPDTPNFPLERAFCLVGTDAADYDVAFGASAKAVGIRSDGLVQIENAQIPKASRAFVHRSHSGRYGIVNSEEGYQNLRRFLFGDLAVAARLAHLTLPTSDKGKHLVWQAESQLSVRGLSVLLDDQVTAHYCPIELGQNGHDMEFQLVTSCLKTQLAVDRPARYSLHVRILSLHEEGGVFGFGDHLEQTADFDDILVVDVKRTGETISVWAQWNSEIKETLRDYDPSTESPLKLDGGEDGVWDALIPLPPAGLGMFGEKAAIHMTARSRAEAG